MFPMQQQMSEAVRVQFETQLALYNELSQTAIESLEKLVHLNIAAARASMEESSAVAREVLSARDPQQLLTLVHAQTGPNVGKAIAYSNHLVNIATNAQTDFARAAESQIAAASRKTGELVAEAAKGAPPGVDNMLTMMQSAIGNASSGYEQLNKSTRQAAEVLEANVNAAVNQIVQPVVPGKE